MTYKKLGISIWESRSLSSSADSLVAGRGSRQSSSTTIVTILESSFHYQPYWTICPYQVLIFGLYPPLLRCSCAEIAHSPLDPRLQLPPINEAKDNIHPLRTITLKIIWGLPLDSPHPQTYIYKVRQNTSHLHYPKAQTWNRKRNTPASTTQ